jgi:DNA repair protein RecO (recombination protein O)
MEWSDDAIVLGSKPFGESKAIVEVFAAGQGRVAGVMHGGGGRRAAPIIQPGNLLRVGWKARLAEQLGFFSPVELLSANAARLMNDAAALAGLSSAIALVRAATPERQAYPGVYAALLLLTENFDQPALWPALYTRFELGLLAALGYGLDLSQCAVTGAVTDLAYVSPRTGRAASREAGAEYADKLLALPPFLADPNAPLAEGDVADAFALAGYFLERRVFDRVGEGLPEPRRRLIELLGHAGRL